MKLIEAFNQVNTTTATMIAADHVFSCNCVPCLTFLVNTGLEYYGDAECDPEWVALKNSEVESVQSLHHLPEATLFELRKLIDRYL